MNATPPHTRLRQEFQRELHGYYQMHEEANGSGLEGTIYPPDIESGDEVALEDRVEDLSTFLSRKDGMTYRPTPALGEGRIQDRAEVAAAASGWVEACGKVALQAATSMIVDPSIRAMVQVGFETCDPEFFKAPSSKSGMFHPADEINEGGLAVHTARVVQMGEHLGEFFGLEEREQDILRAGLLLHDTVKGGVPWKGYANDHGELAGEMIEGLEGPEDAKQGAAQIASNHMALWRKTADNKPNPAVPDNKMDMIASLADYLAARDNIYVDVPGVDKSIEPTITPEDRMQPNTYVGTTRNRSKAFPRGLTITTDKESLRVTINGQTVVGHINHPDIDGKDISYGGFEPEDGGENPLEGMDLKMNFWLLTGARGGFVSLQKGDQKVDYFVRPPKE